MLYASLLPSYAWVLAGEILGKILLESSGGGSKGLVQQLFFRFPRPPLLLCQCAEGLIMFVR